jgi:hypothetical protein
MFFGKCGKLPNFENHKNWKKSKSKHACHE